LPDCLLLCVECLVGCFSSPFLLMMSRFVFYFVGSLACSSSHLSLLRVYHLLRVAHALSPFALSLAFGCSRSTLVKRSSSSWRLDRSRTCPTRSRYIERHTLLLFAHCCCCCCCFVSCLLSSPLLSSPLLITMFTHSGMSTWAFFPQTEHSNQAAVRAWRQECAYGDRPYLNGVEADQEQHQAGQGA
jgi:hypothetical protein